MRMYLNKMRTPKKKCVPHGPWHAWTGLSREGTREGWIEAPFPNLPVTCTRRLPEDP